MGAAPRPPYSFGQCRQAQPPSAFFFCQALPTSTISSFSSLMRPSDAFDSSASYRFGVDPLADFGAERGFLRGIIEIHGALSLLSFRGVREAHGPGISVHNLWI